MKAEILTIGDELLIGQVINSNAAVIARMLNSIGVDVTRALTVGDNEEDILQAFNEGITNFDITVVTGGLGPTHDDITKKVLCDYFGTDLIRSEDVIEDIATLRQRRNLVWSAATETQAMVPRSCTVIRNKNGTAPGLLFEKGNHYMVAMPGVPFEMEGMMEQFVLPFFRPKATGSVILHRTLNTTGIGEAVLFEKLGNLNELLGDVKLAFLPSPTGVRLRLTIIDALRAVAEEKIKRAEHNIRAKISEYIYSTEQETIADTICKLMTERHLTLAVAESCTGGYISNQLTNVSGSSGYFERGAITYSNQSKVAVLGVPNQLVLTHGAVSKEVAEAMAEGIRKVAGTDYGLSTTGIAGPTGGTPEKPVGLVYIGYSDKDQTFSMKFNFGDNRLRFKERATQAALNLLRKKLLQL